MNNSDITRTVTLGIDEFLSIRDDADDLDILLENIFKNARLGYGDTLLINDTELNNVLKYIAPNFYANTVARLKLMEKMKKAAEKANTEDDR